MDRWHQQCVPRRDVPGRTALSQVPDWILSSPTGKGVSYDGSSYFNSGPLYRADADRPHSLTLTFTKAGTFPYVNVLAFFMGMQGSVIVTP
jgi:hypothetical protein